MSHDNLLPIRGRPRHPERPAAGPKTGGKKTENQRDATHGYDSLLDPKTRPLSGVAWNAHTAGCDGQERPGGTKEAFRCAGMAPCTWAPCPPTSTFTRGMAP